MHVLAIKETSLGTIELIKLVHGESMFNSLDELPHGTLSIIDDHAQRHSVEVRIKSNGEAPQKFDRKVMREILENHLSSMIGDSIQSLIPAGRHIHEYDLCLNGEESSTRGGALEHQFQVLYTRHAHLPYVAIRFYPSRGEVDSNTGSSAAVSVTLKNGVSIHAGAKLATAEYAHRRQVTGTIEIFGQELPFSIQYKPWPEFYRFVSREAIVKALEQARVSSPILQPGSGWQGGVKSWQFDHVDPVVG